MNIGRSGTVRHVVTVLGGLVILATLMWFTLHAEDVELLFHNWGVPAVALLHLVAEGGCGYAWCNVVAPPRPGFWAFFRARWVRASVASLTPLSGIGGALAAIRLLSLAQLPVDIAVPSLVLDSTIEMATQVIFTSLGFAALFAFVPQLSVLQWAGATLSVAVLSVVLFVAAQRFGAFRLVDAGLRRLAARRPMLLPLSEPQMHHTLMAQYRRRGSVVTSAGVHLGCWLIGAGEVWLALYALSMPTPLEKCLVIESLGMAARSAGFFIPGALGIQEVALVLVGGLVGLPAQTAMLLAIVKRLRDVVLGVPGLFIWQWLEGRRFDRLLLAPRE